MTCTARAARCGALVRGQDSVRAQSDLICTPRIQHIKGE
jgi:hypothetical protein